MLEEGVAREVVNKVQKLRKKVSSPTSPSPPLFVPPPPINIPSPSLILQSHTSLSFPLPPSSPQAGLKPTDPARVFYEALPSEGDGSQTAAVELSDIIQRQMEYIAASIKLDLSRKQGEIPGKVLEKDTQKVHMYVLELCAVVLSAECCPQAIKRSMCWV